MARNKQGAFQKQKVINDELQQAENAMELDRYQRDIVPTNASQNANVNRANPVHSNGARHKRSIHQI